MERAIDAWEKFIHTAVEIPQLARLGLIHYQFEIIHPFLDGNGRVGRLLMVLLLVEWELISQPMLNLSAYFQSPTGQIITIISWQSAAPVSGRAGCSFF